MRPNEDSVTAVNEWLGEHGLTATYASPAGDWLSVQVPISAANDLLAANYTTFTHSVTGKQTVRTLTYSIPSDLVDHIDLVHPTISSVVSTVVYASPSDGFQFPKSSRALANCSRATGFI